MITDIIFNEDHYRNVRKARQDAKLPTFNDIYPENGRIFNHFLENREFIKNGKKIHLQSLHKHWYRGWYYIFVYYTHYELHPNSSFEFEMIDGKRCGKSHGTIYLRNISCINTIILDSIRKNRSETSLVLTETEILSLEAAKSLLVNKYGENTNYDYIRNLNKIIISRKLKLDKVETVEFIYNRLIQKFGESEQEELFVNIKNIII